MGDLHCIGSNTGPDIDTARKDKVDAEGWLTELDEIYYSDQFCREKIDGWVNDKLYFEDSTVLKSNFFSESSITIELSNTSLDKDSTVLKTNFFSESSITIELSNTSLDKVNTSTQIPLKKSNVKTNMQLKGNSSDNFRISISSSAPSTSSHGSGQDNSETLTDLLIWGEITCPSNNNLKNPGFKTDLLVPTPLELSRPLDICHVACGAHHLALVTRQGEIFTWGGVEHYKYKASANDGITPTPIESLKEHNIEFISCGEFHSCAVTGTGELYTWGDGARGTLGHGSTVSHWVPIRISGPLDAARVSHVACGAWHTALVTLAGQLFTFGDGTFGALGHGNRESLAYPKQIESLIGFNAISVACGVWHTAAVISSQSQSQTTKNGIFTGKLFTWGDGDKYRLGHGDRESRLRPTCIDSLVDHNFCKVECGDSVTVGLTDLGQVFTMGSTVYGQLGNPHLDGRNPNLVGDSLEGEIVRELACGSHHVVVLTDKGEVFTWGKGTNGRLGHGDALDRKIPTLVESLKEREVRVIACGPGFTVGVCQRSKRVSGSTDQSQCVTCRQPFGFTRKRHTCYNCKLIYCNSCSSRKSFNTSAPNGTKPYRVCDSCYVKLNNGFSGLGLGLGLGNDGVGSKKKGNLSINSDMIKNLDMKRVNRKTNSVSVVRSVTKSRPGSPFSRRPSPPRSMTPLRTAYHGLSLSKGSADGLKKANETLNEEIQRLHNQVVSLKKKCELQELEVKQMERKAEEATVMAAEESAKSKAAKEVIKTLTSQLKEMAERLPQVQLVNGIPSCESDGTEIHANSTGGALERNSTGDEPQRNGEDRLRVRSLINSSDEIEAEWIEQYEPGVYITLSSLRDGTRDLKRVRFSRRRFGENQAEEWWYENREKVYDRYNVRSGGSHRSSSASLCSSRITVRLEPAKTSISTDHPKTS